MRNLFPKTMLKSFEGFFFHSSANRSAVALFLLGYFKTALAEVSHWHLKSNRIVSINHSNGFSVALFLLFTRCPNESLTTFSSTFTLDLWVNWTRGANSALTIGLNNLLFSPANRILPSTNTRLSFLPSLMHFYDNERGVCNVVQEPVVFNYNPFFCFVERFRTSATFYDYYK